ncbi:MAG: nicotinamide-nucleotide amidohydrolase family protein [Gammaproteobacteria bacterium]|nr:nicotinamide-nucleotide amidohydrolase family protein [Gammaproteobacteria bacterium]MCY4254742.1 nicotinamide-nucleotide amidohydrolase family protein [Gammaproteobacteria bacterium]
MGTEQRISGLVADLGALLRERGERLAAAESCTGGWFAKALTDLPGSSAWFAAGLVAYSNDAKRRLLGVRPETLAAHGAVSRETAAEMAEGALKAGRADWSLAVTGIAGPGGGAEAKPVGTVCFAFAGRAQPPETEARRFEGDRRAVRAQSVEYALSGLLQRLRQPP